MKLLFRGARKLSSYLVRVKRYPLEKIVGSSKCNSKRCQMCLNVEETNSHSSHVTQETYMKDHSFDCNDRCLIYLLTCKNYRNQHECIISVFVRITITTATDSR